MKTKTKAGLSAILLALISDLCNHLDLIVTAKIFQILAIFGVMFILLHFIVYVPVIKNVLNQSHYTTNSKRKSTKR